MAAGSAGTPTPGRPTAPPAPSTFGPLTAPRTATKGASGLSISRPPASRPAPCASPQAASTNANARNNSRSGVAAAGVTDQEGSADPPTAAAPADPSAWITFPRTPLVQAASAGDSAALHSSNAAQKDSTIQPVVYKAPSSRGRAIHQAVASSSNPKPVLRVSIQAPARGS